MEKLFIERPLVCVVIGHMGSGKSSYATTLFDVEHTFKLGLKPSILQFSYTLQLRPSKKHEDGNRRMGLRFKRSSAASLAADIAHVRDRTLFIDEWTTLFGDWVLKDRAYIEARLDEIFEAIDANRHIERVIIVTSEASMPLLFRLYKKLGVINSRLLERADHVTQVVYGVASLIKPPSLTLDF